MEIVVALFILVGGSLAYSAWRRGRSSEQVQPAGTAAVPEKAPSVRTCLSCGYEGEMKTWIANYVAPKCLLVLGFLLGYLPGLIFLMVYWGKYKCGKCGAIGKNQPIGAETEPRP